MWAYQLTLAVKNPPANAGDIRDLSLIPGSGRCPGGGLGNLFQYSCLENPMDRIDWQATVHRVAKSRAQLTHLACTHILVSILKCLLCVEHGFRYLEYIE